ncbi:MAG: ribosome maturation factor RimP [Helicobacteraceae bacterium]|jgi:ribosome maturation factor RimP|nr:ribosome maturation factor RimP [Helicobacteraceae bacterium]
MSLESDIKSMVESLGLTIYDIVTVNENEETIYRVNISSPTESGVTMDQVVQVTKMISPLLDVTSPVSGDYRLEVSSPGIERKLRTLAHFKGALGEKVRMITLDKTKYRGVLKRVDGDKITIESEEGDADVSFKDIAKAATYFEW